MAYRLIGKRERIGNDRGSGLSEDRECGIDLCVFVEKLRLGKKHREEANKLTHNVLNLIKQTGKIKEEPLTKGKKMKKLKIQFWKADKALAMQILEQEGLPERKVNDFIKIITMPCICKDELCLRGYDNEGDFSVDVIYFSSNTERDAYLKKAVKAITDELFTGKGELKIGEMCEVRDAKSACWNRRRLIAILPEKHYFRYITECAFDDRDFNYWKYARPITKRTEPKVEECGQLITYAWEEK